MIGKKIPRENRSKQLTFNLRKFQYIPRGKKVIKVISLDIYIRDADEIDITLDSPDANPIERGGGESKRARRSVLSRFILSIYYSLCIVKRYFYGMNTLPRVTKGHHWRSLNALRCPSTRLLTPSSTVFQPIFPPVAYAIRVNGCNHPYPTAYCFLLYSSRPKIVKERKKRYSLRCIRIINEPWKYVTNPRLLSLSTQPTFICLSIGGKLKVGRRE